MINRKNRRVVPAVYLGLGVILVGSACGPSRPPADFAPEPGLAARIREIRMETPTAACPGSLIRTSYYAVLDDGSELPFQTRYDKDRPPALHVVMLSRTSPDATAREDGNWEAVGDPLMTAMRGFRLSAFLKARRSVNGFVSVPPEYGCVRQHWEFAGEGGGRGAAGGNGPDITARIGILSSPYYDRLLVASLEVGVAPPFYVLADANVVPPADWLTVVTRGGHGGRGESGTDGSPGAAGEAGCPGSAGGAGGAGGNGGRGGPGGRGGRITVYAPDEDPFLAGLIDGRALGGEGGGGGKGGEGGAGGKGGAAATSGDRRCNAGPDGAKGANGSDGPEGRDGPEGPPPASATLPLFEVFGARAHPQLRELLDYTFGGPSGEAR